MENSNIIKESLNAVARATRSAYEERFLTQEKILNQLHERMMSLHDSVMNLSAEIQTLTKIVKTLPNSGQQRQTPYEVEHVKKKRKISEHSAAVPSGKEDHEEKGEGLIELLRKVVNHIRASMTKESQYGHLWVFQYHQRKKKSKYPDVVYVRRTQKEPLWPAMVVDLEAIRTMSHEVILAHPVRAHVQKDIMLHAHDKPATIDRGILKRLCEYVLIFYHFDGHQQYGWCKFSDVAPFSHGLYAGRKRLPAKLSRAWQNAKEYTPDLSPKDDVPMQITQDEKAAIGFDTTSKRD